MHPPMRCGDFEVGRQKVHHSLNRIAVNAEMDEARVASKVVENLGSMLGMLLSPDIKDGLLICRVTGHRPLEECTFGVLHPRSYPSLDVSVIQHEIGLREGIMESSVEAVAFYETVRGRGNQVAVSGPPRKVLA